MMVERGGSGGGEGSVETERVGSGNVRIDGDFPKFDAIEFC